jgi:hypothetical protein
MVASHIPLLTQAFDESAGPVLELGTGYFSTLLLHWLATISKRQVFSFERSRSWYERAKRWQNEWHHIEFCPDWDALPIDDAHWWGLAFVDHSPNGRRPAEIRRLALRADYIVIHDTLPEWDAIYGYSAIWGLFQHRYDYTKIHPWTTVVSNFHDLEEFRCSSRS